MQMGITPIKPRPTGALRYDPKKGIMERYLAGEHKAPEGRAPWAGLPAHLQVLAANRAGRSGWQQGAGGETPYVSPTQPFKQLPGQIIQQYQDYMPTAKREMREEVMGALPEMRRGIAESLAETGMGRSGVLSEEYGRLHRGALGELAKGARGLRREHLGLGLDVYGGVGLAPWERQTMQERIKGMKAERKWGGQTARRESADAARQRSLENLLRKQMRGGR